MQWLTLISVISTSISDFHCFSSFRHNFPEGLRNSNFYQLHTLSMWKDCFWNSFLVRPNIRNLNNKFARIAKNYILLRKDFHFIWPSVPSLHFSLLCSRKTIELRISDALVMQSFGNTGRFSYATARKTFYHLVNNFILKYFWLWVLMPIIYSKIN